MITYQKGNIFHVEALVNTVNVGIMQRHRVGSSSTQIISGRTEICVQSGQGEARLHVYLAGQIDLVTPQSRIKQLTPTLGRVCACFYTIKSFLE